MKLLLKRGTLIYISEAFEYVFVMCVGSGFQLKHKYRFGWFSMKLRLVPGGK